MKLLKYAILSMVIIAACKKITPKNNSSDFNKRKKLSTNVSKYNDDKRIAQATNTTFVAVYEYDPKISHIPPNKIVPAMIPFGTIHTPKSSSKSDKFTSKYKDTLSLYGIPVDGYRKPIRKTHTHQAIGFFWKDQDQVKGDEYGLGIAQMHSGDTYVGVKPVHMPNYIEKFHDASYSDIELELLKERYGVTSNKPVLLGTTMLGTLKYSGPYKRQKYIIYGIKMPNIEEINDHSMIHQQLLNSKKIVSYPLIVYKAIQKYLETTNKAASTQSTMHPSDSISHRDAAMFVFNT